MPGFSMRLTFEYYGPHEPAGSLVAHWRQGRHGAHSDVEITLTEMVHVRETVVLGGTAVGVTDGPQWCTRAQSRQAGLPCRFFLAGKIKHPPDCNGCDFARWNRKAGDRL